MSKILTTCALILLFVPTVYSQKPKSDRVEAGLRGTVRSMSEEEARMTNRSGAWAEGKRLPSLMMVFDVNGNFTKRVLYDWAGNPRNEEEYSLDSESNRVVHHRNYSRSYDPPAPASPPARRSTSSVAQAENQRETLPDGSTVSTYTTRYKYKYDAKGKRIERIGLREDGADSWRDVYAYDARGTLSSITVYNADGKRTRVSSYDSRGNEVSTAYYAADGKQNFRSTYTYDNKDNRIEAAYFRGSDIVTEKYSYNYEFDARSNWTKRVAMRWVTKDGKSYYEPYTVDYRTIIYY